MTPPQISNRYIFLGLLLAVFINVLPLLIFRIGGDILFQFLVIDCFAHQFWQGDLFPRWCFEANAGLGSPVLLFYSPLPFYITSFFYPLVWLGFDTYTVYVIGVFLATSLTAATLYYWLKDVASPGVALLATTVALFVPYRMETVVYRSAFAEMWALALLPLLFKCARDLTHGKPRATLFYGITLGIMWFTHVPVAVAGALFSGFYIMMLKPKALPNAAVGGICSLVFASIYLLPAFHYRQFIFGDRLYSGAKLWSSSFFNMNHLIESNVTLAGEITLISIVALILGAGFLFYKSHTLSSEITRELIIWCALFIIAVLLLFPISKPLYDLTKPLSDMALPWRMQSMFMLCAGYFIAFYGQNIISAKQLKTWKADYAVLFLFLVGASFFVGGSLDSRYANLIKEAYAAHFLIVQEYRTQWTDQNHTSMAAILERAKQKDRPKIEVMRGHGTIKVDNWDWRGIVFSSASAKNMSLKLDHTYFPIWKAKDETGQTVALSPEQDSGQMLVDIPAGNHRVTVNYR